MAAIYHQRAFVIPRFGLEYEFASVKVAGGRPMVASIIIGNAEITPREALSLSSWLERMAGYAVFFNEYEQQEANQHEQNPEK